jgi:ankyrin repeat protein
MAASNENPEVLTLLLDAGADVNARDFDGVTPLHMAASNENPEVLTLLLDAGADVNARDEHSAAPILWAAKNPNLEVLKVLIDAGADVNAINRDGVTPVLGSIIEENLEALRALLAAGASLDARLGSYYTRQAGYTGLHLAARYGETPEVITLLLDAGADGTAVNEDGETPFDLAKDNEALAGTDAYWALNDARFE